jgi:hypothetical protein
MVKAKELLSGRTIFWLIAGLILVVLPLLSRQYGMSGDEWLQMDYGKHIWNYFAGVDKQALDYSNMSRQYSNQEYYGGLFDFSMEALHRLFPSVQILHLRHFFNALLAAVMMMFTGLLAFRLSGKWLVGILALLFMLFSPRIFGEGMNNPKDIPFACGFIVAIYNLVSLLYCFREHLLRHTIGLAIGCGIAFGVRPGGFLLIVACIALFTGIYFLVNREFREAVLSDHKKLLYKILLYLAAAIAVGYIICLAVWPYGQQSPVGNLFNAINGMTNRDTYMRNLFEGKLIRDDHMPWYYELKWILISNPLVVIAGVVLFIVQFMKVNKHYGKTVLMILLFAAFFPLFYVVQKHSTLYDTWRHMFFVYPFWVVMAALGWDLLGTYIGPVKYRRLPAVIAVLGLLPVVIWTFRSHPNQYVYFNETVGGLEGAYGYYETDYYQNSGLQAAKWIKQNIRPVSGRKTVVRSNMVGFNEYFAGDTSWLSYSYGRYEERNQNDWDYYITYSRFILPEVIQEHKWPPQGVIHQVTTNGVPLCIVIHRKNKAGIKAYEAYKRKDFVTAVQYYDNLIKQDSTDPYVYLYYGVSMGQAGDLDNIDKGIAAVNKAIVLQPRNPQFYNELSKLYASMGDLYNEQQAKNMANSLVIQDLAGGD